MSKTTSLEILLKQDQDYCLRTLIYRNIEIKGIDFATWPVMSLHNLAGPTNKNLVHHDRTRS